MPESNFIRLGIKVHLGSPSQPTSPRESRLAKAPPADPASMHRIGLWASLVEAVTEIWQSRELLGQLAFRDIRIRYKQAVMGFGWAILMPILIVGAGLVVRRVLSQSAGVPINQLTVSGTP